MGIKSIKLKVLNVGKTITNSYIRDFKIRGKNIKYGNNKRQYYKVYTPYDSNIKSTIFFIHGGGWWHGNPSLYSGIGKFFYKLGYQTVLCGYRLVPFHRYPIQIEDVFEALSNFINNNKDINSIVIAGYSAGGELASRIVFDKNRRLEYGIDENLIKGFISLSGVLDFSKCTSMYSKILINNYVYKDDKNKANPINLLNKTVDVPILCIHGDNDSLINVNTSVSFVDKVVNLDENTILKIIKKGEHEDTIDLVRGYGNKYSEYILKFIKEIDNSKETDI